MTDLELTEDWTGLREEMVCLCLGKVRRPTPGSHPLFPQAGMAVHAYRPSTQEAVAFLKALPQKNKTVDGRETSTV